MYSKIRQILPCNSYIKFKNQDIIVNENSYLCKAPNRKLNDINFDSFSHYKSQEKMALI